MFQTIRTAVQYLKRENIKKIVSILWEYLWKQYLFILFLPLMIRRLQDHTSTKDADALIDFMATFWHGFITPFQVRYELVELFKYVNKEKPRYILEIGTALGGTLFSLCRATPEDAVIISIDLPMGLGGGGYSMVRVPLYKSFASKHQCIHLIRGDSHKEETVEKLRAILGGNAIDFLFIDGDHTYEGAKKDFEMYSPLVKKNGTIALHDILKSRYTWSGVHLLWDEIKTNYEHQTIVKDQDQQWAGIGLIKK